MPSRQTGRSAGTDLTKRIGLDHGEQVGGLSREEEKIEFRVPASDGVRLVSEIPGDGSSHQMKGPAGDTKPASGIGPGTAGSLIAEGGIKRFNDFRNGDELFDVVLAKIDRFHFVCMMKTPLQSSEGGDFFNCSQRSRYICEAKSAE